MNSKAMNGKSRNLGSAKRETVTRLKAVLRKRIHEVPPGADQGKRGL